MVGSSSTTADGVSASRFDPHLPFFEYPIALPALRIIGIAHRHPRELAGVLPVRFAVDPAQAAAAAAADFAVDGDGSEVVDDGVAFPQLDDLDHESGLAFFEEQTYTGIAVDSDTNEIVGLYILHPNNVGRCGHI